MSPHQPDPQRTPTHEGANRRPCPPLVFGCSMLVDMNIILHLSHYWWTPDNLPHPSVETIAKAVGIGARAVQKRIKALHELGMIEREERRNTPHGSLTNKYGFKGLIEKATPFAQEKIAEIQRRQQEKQDRLARKKPKLTVVAGGFFPPSSS